MIFWGNIYPCPKEYQLNNSNYSAHVAYEQSKLFDRMLTVGQAAELKHVTCLSLDPGTVNTKMLLAGWGSCGIPVGEADDTFWLATNKDIGLDCSGSYYASRRQSRHHNFSTESIDSLFRYLDELIQEKTT